MVATVVSFINMKGGVGKTTFCKELGYYMAKVKNDRILFIDIDPQSNLTQSLFRKYGYKQKDELRIEDGSEGHVNAEYSETEVSIESIFSSGRIDDNPNNAILELEENIDIIPGTLNDYFA